VDDAKRAELLLRESEARFRQLADAMPQIVWTADARGEVEYFNRRWEEYTGIPVERSRGGAWAEVLHADDRAAAVGRWEHAVATGGPYESEYRFRRHDGEYRWQLARGLPVRGDAGAVVRWFGTCTDIHAHRLADEAAQVARAQAEQANRAKDEFLAALSHELRTPLTPVLVTAQMLEDDRSLSEEVRHDLRVIRQNVELETRLIDDLLDLTRVSRGKLTLHRDRVDVHAILRDAMRTCCDDVAAQKRLAVRLEAGAAHPHVRGDAARLSQVFWNLLKNAVKFTPAGGEIVVRTVNPSPGELVVSVTDTGVGIDPDVLPHVFNAFEQGGSAVTRKFGGLGLGLAIGRALAEMHGGRIEAHSGGPGHGATFTLTLPVLAASSPAVRVADATAAVASAAWATISSAPAGGGRRILLVEDHEQTGKALRRLLTNLGYDVEWRSSVGDALDAAGREAFDLVLSDIGLPDGSGLELMRELRARHGLRGIALSGYGMEQDLASSAAAGFLEHLVKPISRDLLGAAIRRHLG
jgi:PAS domain S-box-containing protein